MLLTTEQTAELTGCSKVLLQAYAREGVLTPQVVGTRGRSHRWSLMQVLGVGVSQVLRHMRLPEESICYGMRLVGQMSDHEWSTTVESRPVLLVVPGATVGVDLVTRDEVHPPAIGIDIEKMHARLLDCITGRGEDWQAAAVTAEEEAAE